ncbi:hypothetical protein V7150_25370 [Neobacillus drentensis]|uniref:hypothetical protein n=1 Tax=Neobacillus drentensis TaxID=220684 RepID=UPI003000D087
MYEIMHDMKTIVKKKPFKYISNGNKEIFFGKSSSPVKLSKEQYTKLLDTFKGRTVTIGTSRTDPPKDSLGEWLMNNITKTAIASYIVPILLMEGHASLVMPIDSGKIKFNVVKFGECSNCGGTMKPLIPFAASFLCARCIRNW